MLKNLKCIFEIILKYRNYNFNYFAKIIFQPSNKQFSYIKDSLFVGKSSESKETFDIKIIACCDIDEIINNDIKIIKPY